MRRFFHSQFPLLRTRFLILLLCLASCNKDPSTIKYTVSGTGPSITADYVDGDGIHETFSGTSPWQTTFTANSGANLSITGGSGTIGTSEVHIFIDGVDKAHDVRNGVNATATTTVP